MLAWRCVRRRALRVPRALSAVVIVAALAAFTTTACSPISSTLTFPISPKSSAWGPGSWSQDQGVDIIAPCGALLVAAASGRIIGEGINGFGPYTPLLLVDSGPLAGRMIYYGHVQRLLVPVGSHVSRGQRLAQVGTMGLSYGCHVEVGISRPGSRSLPGFYSTSSELLSLLASAYFH